MMPKTVCFDTNVLIDLSAVYFNHSQAKDLKKNNKKHYDNILRMLNLIKNEEIKIIVLPMVLFEVAEVSMKHNFRTMEFLEQFKNVIKVVTYKNSKIRRKLTVIDNLAETYCKTSNVTTRRGKKVTFKPVFNIIQENPAWDAYVMAQTTIMGLPLITRDSDFLKENRPVRIKNINKIFVKKEVRPYSLRDYLNELYKAKAQIVISKPQEAVKDEAMAYV